MLSYHGAFDLNHCIYRMIRLIEEHPEKSMQVDAFRVLDYYLLFPHELQKPSWPRALSKRAADMNFTETKYNRINSPRHMAHQLELIEDLGAKSLAAKGLLDPGDLERRVLTRTTRLLPSELESLISRGSGREDQLVAFLARDLSQIPLLGDKGLKARSGLLEHRYDA